MTIVYSFAQSSVADTTWGGHSSALRVPGAAAVPGPADEGEVA